MSDSLVSIIIPTKNSSEFLEECLNSVKNQTYKNLEIIVVDNNSTDNTKEIALKYTNKVFNKGPERSAQRNFGAKNSKGKYLLFIDSDMGLSEKVIESCVQKIRKNKNIKGIIIPEESFGAGFWAQCKKLEKSFYIGIDWMEASRFFEKKVFEEVGKYDKNLTSGEDWDLSQRIGEKYNIGRISEFIYHNEGKINLFKTVQKKFYYAKKFDNYVQKKENKKKIKKQASAIDRYKLFFSNPKKLFANPIIGLGMLSMKSCEFGFGGLGYLITNNKIKDKKIDIEQYSEAAPQYYSSHIPSLLLEYINKKQYDSIIDCGCGDGSLLDALKKKGYLKNKKVFAIDLSNKRINLIRKNIKNIIAKVDNAENLYSIKDDSIDFFIATQVIEHIDDNKMLKNIKRVVKNGGYVYLSTVYKKWYGWYFYRCNNKWVIDPTHLREYSNDKELFKFITENKFEILENIKSPLYFPIIDFFVKRVKIKNRKIFDNKFLRIIRNIKIPISGYYNWEIVLYKNT